MNWDKNWKATIWFKNKKSTSARFPSFQLCPIPKIENLEILERFVLAMVVSQNLKTPKNELRQKPKACDMA